MTDKVLVTYASKCGSTAEVAQAIAGELTGQGAEVDLLPVNEVKTVAPYRAVVLGTAIRMGKPIKPSLRFARRHSTDLKTRPLALFSLGIQMRDEVDDKRERTLGMLAPLLAELPEPVTVGTFAGKVDHSRLGFLLRKMAAKDDTGALREGDWRDWETIRAWAGEVGSRLV